MPGIQAGALDPRFFNSRVRQYSFKDSSAVQIGALEYPLGVVALFPGHRGRVIGAGIWNSDSADATGDFDYNFSKVIAAGNGLPTGCTGDVVSLQKPLAIGSLVSVAARTLHLVGAEAITGTATAGGAATITLEVADAGTDDGAYEQAMITILSGTGAGQIRRIITYVQSTRVATVATNWTVQPVAGSVYLIESMLAHTEYEDHVGVAQAGGASTITLEAEKAVRQDTYYSGSVVTNLATGESRTIITYVEATQVATVSAAWSLGNPAAGTPYRIRHDNLIVRPNDLLICTVSGLGGGQQPTRYEMFINVLELSEENTNNFVF